jgi:MFS family permease
LAGLALAMLLASLGTSSAQVALPTLARAFDASFPEVQWVVLAYLLAVTSLVVGVGRLADVQGRRRLLLAGLGLFTAASAVCGLAPTLGLLIAGRAAQGLGAAALMALAMTFVAATVPKGRVGRAMGLLGTMSAVGTALGPPLGGILVAGFGWRAVFLVNVPLGLLAWRLAFRGLPADCRLPAAEGARFDGLGTLLLAATLTAYALAMTVGHGGLLLAALAGAGLFVLAEARAASPLIRPAMFRDPTLSTGLATGALVTTVVMATLVVGPFYLSGALGLDAARIGLVMSSGPIVAALVGVPAGRLVDRQGAGRVTLAGLAGMAVGAAILPWAARFGLPGYMAPLVVVTAGYAMFQAANNTAVMAAARPDQRGVVSGLLGLSRHLGLVTGAAVMGAVFAWGSGTGDLAAAAPEALAAGLRTTLAVAAALVVAALAIAVASHALAPARLSRCADPAEPSRMRPARHRAVTSLSRGSGDSPRPMVSSAGRCRGSGPVLCAARDWKGER